MRTISHYKLGTGTTGSFKKLQARCGSYLNVLQREIVNVSARLGETEADGEGFAETIMPLEAGTVSGELPGGVVEEVETLSELELEVEVDAGLNDAEAPAGSPLTLSETGPLKPILPVTLRSVGSAAAPHNSTSGWNAEMGHGNCVRPRMLPSGSLNQAILAPPGAVQMPCASWPAKP